MSETEKKTLGIAIASLVFGCLFLIPILNLLFCPIAIILGIISLVKISKNKETLKGQGLAIAGISLGGIGIILIPILALLAAIAIPNLLRARSMAQEAAASASLQTIAVAQIQYKSTNSKYASLLELGGTNPPYIDLPLAQGTKQGYEFSVSTDKQTNFYATAVPENTMVSHTLYIDDDGVLCRSDNLNIPAPTTYVGEGCPAGFSENK